MVSRQVLRFAEYPKRHQLCIVAASLCIAGCDVTQERRYLKVRPASLSDSIQVAPTQSQLVGALLEFASDQGFRCRQHVKRWDEYSCNGPQDMRITFEPDWGRDQFVVEFTLVTTSEESRAGLRETVEEFEKHMNTRFLTKVTLER